MEVNHSAHISFFLTGLEDKYMMETDWENCVLEELDITSTELSKECLLNVLPRMPGFKFLCVGHCDFFDDTVSAAVCMVSDFRSKTKNF